ncbi:hypothetical protein VFPPC_15742 [Pochonia chlamydosporia 170]|uniref:Uncharacterized protein n=1 Tax=Pochonia chlamydosporia 170 TaxID=1380566 RepID=A0A179FS61_METCM|nr:hypothetical protein VFPPC_15742 [Pochonia chlamydosporia 170]OAQ67849.1 hypothetical protein VFPPC_15742 [Pochonia chlamydosporia 170]
MHLIGHPAVCHEGAVGLSVLRLTIAAVEDRPVDSVLSFRHGKRASAVDDVHGGQMLGRKGLARCAYSRILEPIPAQLLGNIFGREKCPLRHLTPDLCERTNHALVGFCSARSCSAFKSGEIGRQGRDMDPYWTGDI